MLRIISYLQALLLVIYIPPFSDALERCQIISLNLFEFF